MLQEVCMGIWLTELVYWILISQGLQEKTAMVVLRTKISACSVARRPK